jgi:hypothetical protein
VLVLFEDVGSKRAASRYESNPSKASRRFSVRGSSETMRFG